jgi:hypothetical protein
VVLRLNIKILTYNITHISETMIDKGFLYITITIYCLSLHSALANLFKMPSLLRTFDKSLSIAMIDNFENRFGNMVGVMYKCLFDALLRMFFHKMRNSLELKALSVAFCINLGKQIFPQYSLATCLL